ACKHVLTFARAVQMLRSQGLEVHAVAAGNGSQRPQIKELLGDNISLLGNIEHEQLGLVFASCDAFIFPSETETVGNVVLEAKASGLVPIVSDQGGVTQLINQPGEDGVIIPGQNPEDWAAAVKDLYDDPQRRSHMSQAARVHLQENWPTWDAVLEEDLLPVWKAFK
ncbi:MAG: glycosyltransferase family 4 protein, partial [Cyanobacteria bacterium P01_F01_bin.42]